MRKKICLLLVIVLCAYGLLFVGAHKGPFTAYAPLRGQVFAVHAETVDAICIQSGMSGVMLEFDSPAEKEEMAQLLNGFTSHIGIPGNGGPGHGRMVLSDHHSGRRCASVLPDWPLLGQGQRNVLLRDKGLFQGCHSTGERRRRSGNGRISGIDREDKVRFRRRCSGCQTRHRKNRI